MKYNVELVAFNILTGRKVWLLRETENGEYGEDWVSSLVLVRKNYLNRDALIMLAESITTVAQYKSVRRILRTLGFNKAHAIRHGKRKNYAVLPILEIP